MDMKKWKRAVTLATTTREVLEDAQRDDKSLFLQHAAAKALEELSRLVLELEAERRREAKPAIDTLVRALHQTILAVDRIAGHTVAAEARLAPASEELDQLLAARDKLTAAERSLMERFPDVWEA
jgi:DNA repair exonuclease SbcCD ATPase subunit